MSTSPTDILGNPLTPIERQLVEAHGQLTAILRDRDIPPAVRAGIAHAAASTWQVLNDLDIEAESPPDL